MTKQEFINWALSRGWTQDKFGHLQKTIIKRNELDRDGHLINSSKTYRFKLSSTHVRYERKANIVDHNEWLRLGGAYYKDLSINSSNKLVGI
jgi:hypothetical protein